ncbi:DNA methyltransferase [Ferrimicrobium sp.]|uniref:Eco57I restriction-modification methylase domain-containing protein n=1 Tax=Ferrimicrobium sp. TaxID=2926050 RepID=UPI00262CBD51|nr:DNA methyltransferase [Ferrimicrobium sp.]
MSTQATGVGITSVGGLLPIEFLARLRDPNSGLEGLRPSDYHLGANERITEIVSRSWNRLTNAWRGFSESLAQLDETDTASGLTRDKWLGVIFNELGYGRLQRAKTIEIQGETYPLSHEWGSIPIHLVGAGVALDRRTPGVRGAAGKSPHSLVQELLNRSSDRLWGIVSNGIILRILRDSTSLTRQSYLEFDLEAIFSNERFDDFVTLWMIVHESRFEGDEPSTCWLERWRGKINESGIRALDALQGGVRHAIEAIGEGLITHPNNQQLRGTLTSGELSSLDLYRQILRLIYRILFLFVAEDRQLLHGTAVDPIAIKRYEQWYSTKRLREQAWGARSDRHADLWEMLKVVMDGLGDPAGLAPLGLGALGSFLWSDQAIPDLLGTTISNRSLGAAILHLSTTESEGVRRRVDFANLGAEELGSVYEALLELNPRIHEDGKPFALRDTPGNERKTSGSFYTPSELVASLLESALDPVIEEALAKSDPEAALLSIRVLDPACGSGHFLIAAAHRMAERLAAFRAGESEAPPAQVRHALREVIAKCCYGIDINPMAVELAKVSLWMEAMEAGKPLTFLERHIVTGNALIGTTPELVADGIPDEAYKVLDGDDKTTAGNSKRRNKDFRRGRLTLDVESIGLEVGALAAQAAALDAIDDDNINDVAAKAQLWEELQHQSSFASEKWAADAWCAAFFYHKVPQGGEITSETVEKVRLGGSQALSERERELIEKAAKDYQFLHFHIAFPEVFFPTARPGDEHKTRENAGFDVVLGNPPWGQVELDPVQFFAIDHPEVSQAQNMAARDRMIKELLERDALSYQGYVSAKQALQRFQAFVHSSGRFALTSRGRLNTAPLFAELARHAINPMGLVGIIVPSGIATDSFTQYFFQDIISAQSLASLYDFENRSKLFPAVDSRQKFCLLTITGVARQHPAADFVLFAQQVADLNVPERHVTLSTADFELINPNTGNMPIFRSRDDAELARDVYARVPVLVRTEPSRVSPWDVKFKLMFMMNTDSNRFLTRRYFGEGGFTLSGSDFVNGTGERYLPLYEGKLIHHFDHRFATFEGVVGDKPIEADNSLKTDPKWAILPRYWVSEAEVKEKLDGWDREWLIGFRDIARSTDERTLIASVVPATAVGNNLPLLLAASASGPLAGALLACLNSFALDTIARMKVGGTHMNFYVTEQLPVLPPDVFDQRVPWEADSNQSLADWIAVRVLELTYTAWDLKPWARELGYDGEPFIWNDSQRTKLRAELDACFFNLYGYSRDQADRALGSFPIVKRNDERDYGEFRTKRLILEHFDRYSQ